MMGLGLPLQAIRGAPKRTLPNLVTVSLYAQSSSFSHLPYQSDCPGVALRRAAPAWWGLPSPYPADRCGAPWSAVNTD